MNLGESWVCKICIYCSDETPFILSPRSLSGSMSFSFCYEWSSGGGAGHNALQLPTFTQISDHEISCLFQWAGRVRVLHNLTQLCIRLLEYWRDVFEIFSLLRTMRRPHNLPWALLTWWRDNPTGLTCPQTDRTPSCWRGGDLDLVNGSPDLFCSWNWPLFLWFSRDIRRFLRTISCQGTIRTQYLQW